MAQRFFINNNYSGRVFPWVFLISCMFLCIYLSRAVFGPLLPYIENDFNISHAAATRLLLYLSVGFALGIFISGFTATRVQPRHMTGYSVLGSGAFMIAIGFTNSLSALPPLLIVLGLVGGQYLNGAMRVLREIVRPADWSMAVALHEVGPPACFLLTPVLAESLASRFGWRVAVGVMGWACVVFGLFFLFVAKSGRTPSPPVSLGGLRSILKNPMSWLFAWLAGVGVAGEIAAYSVMTMYLTEERGVAADTAAYLLSFSRLASPLTVFVGAWLCTRFGTKKSLAICLATFAASLILLAMPWKAVYFSGMFLQPTVAAMIFPPIFIFLVEQFSADEQSTILAIGMPIGCLLGVGLAPSLLGLSGDLLSFSTGFVIFGVVVGATLPLLALIPPRKTAMAGN